jgi:hypothetical protein
LNDAREEWIQERMAIIDEGSTAKERHNRGKLREVAEADWQAQVRARKPKRQARMFNERGS